MLIGAQVFGLLSMGSALVIPVCTALIGALFHQRAKSFWLTWLGTAGLCAGYLAAFHHPHPAIHPTFSASFFLRMASWPADSLMVGIGLLVILALVLRHRPSGTPIQPAQGISIGLAVFAVVNMGLIALSRRPEEFHARHWDTVALFPLGLGCLCAQITVANSRYQRLLKFAVRILVVAIAASLAWRIQTQTRPYLVDAHTHRDENIARYRERLLSGRIQEDRVFINQALEKKDYAFFDDPVYRYAMPPTVVHNYLLKPMGVLPLLSPDFIPAREPSLLSLATKQVIRLGPWLLLSIASFTALAGWRKPAKPSG
jgi:hypothetical protein